MNQSDLECPWYILSAVKVACWSESISWTTLEGARRCFGHQKVKVNHLVYGGNFRIGDRKLTWCDTGKGGSSMEFREVRNSKKCVKSGLFFWGKKTKKKEKRKRKKKEKGNKSGEKKRSGKMIFFRGFHFLKFNHKSQKFFLETKKRSRCWKLTWNCLNLSNEIKRRCGSKDLVLQRQKSGFLTKKFLTFQTKKEILWGHHPS